MANARINWKSTFTTLLAGDALAGRDRQVIESMHTHYQRGKSMTAGRKRYFLLIQERTERAAEAMHQRAESGPGGETEMGTRLFDLGVKMGDDSTWDHGYIESLALQEVSGATLTARQIEILERIESKWTDELVAERAKHAENFRNSPDMQSAYHRMMVYYRTSTYFAGHVDLWFANNKTTGMPVWGEGIAPIKIPTFEDYTKITTSKYAVKVLAGYSAAPKYPAGALVFANAQLTYSAAERVKKGAMVMATTGDIISACKGNKLYTLLPIGGTATIQVEERYLKGRK
jgi:hypothetical protein